MFLVLLAPLIFLPGSAAAVRRDSAWAVLESGPFAPPRAIASPAAASTGPGAAPQKDLTVMVYLNAKNDLERFGLADVNEMERIGSTPGMNIVVELGRSAGYDQSDGDWAGSRRYLVTVDADTASITSPVIGRLPAADMGDWKHLADFGVWAKENFPAKRYMLIVWNHGTGWEKFRATPGIRGISYDSDTGSHISPAQLASALAEMGGVDVYASDACRMQTAEVAYEIRNFAEVIVGSEENEYSSGYYYPWFLEKLSADTSATPETLAGFAVDAFREYYAYFNRGATHSAVRASAMRPLAEMLREWGELVRSSGEIEPVRCAKTKAQTFYHRDSKDIYDMVRMITAGTANRAVADKGRALMEFMDARLFAANGTVGSEYAGARGLAVYAPVSVYNPDYAAGSWAKDSNWAEFAAWYAGIRQEGDDWFPPLKTEPAAAPAVE